MVAISKAPGAMRKVGARGEETLMAHAGKVSSPRHRDGRGQHPPIRARPLLTRGGEGSMIAAQGRVYREGESDAKTTRVQNVGTR